MAEKLAEKHITVTREDGRVFDFSAFFEIMESSQNGYDKTITVIIDPFRAKVKVWNSLRNFNKFRKFLRIHIEPNDIWLEGVIVRDFIPITFITIADEEEYFTGKIKLLVNSIQKGCEG